MIRKEESIFRGKYIISEPDDGTRYQYYIIKISEEYSFIPAVSSGIIYPQAINKYSVNPEEDLACNTLRRHGIPEHISSCAKKYRSNPWTVAECYRSIQEAERGNY